MRRRYGDHPGDEVRRQVDYEVGVIVQMGFPSYFLVVADLVRYAKEHGIRVGPGRGSAAGCTVSYCLGITELDPLRYGLIFERFLNPERVSMPDIDMDFDERRRGDMIRYATERYGEDRVAQIITFGTIKAKQAIKDSARVLGFPYAMGDRLTKSMPPPVMGREMSLKECFDPSSSRYGEAAELRQAFETDPDAKRVIETARGLEGLKRQAGVHAAGVVMCRDPLTEHIPVWRRDADGAVITQFDMGTVETLGLLKMDFLGLRNLTVLDDCLRHIEANRGEQVVIEELPLDDPEAYALLCRGESVGVFQLEGGPMRSLMRAHAAHDVRRHLRLDRAVPAGADGCRGPPRLRRAQARAAPARPDPPGAGRAARRRPRRDLRRHRLPGTGDGRRAEGRRLHAGSGRPAAPGDGQEEEGHPRPGVRPVRGGHARQRVTATRRSPSCGRCSSPSPTTPSTRRTRRDTGSSPTGRPTSRRATRPSTWRRCSPRCATTRTRAPSTWPSAGGWASRCCPPTSTTPTPTSPRAAPTSGSGCPRCATSARTSSSR